MTENICKALLLLSFVKQNIPTNICHLNREYSVKINFEYSLL